MKKKNERKIIIGKNLKVTDVKYKEIRYKRDETQKTIAYLEKKQLKSYSVKDDGKYEIVGYLRKGKLGKFSDKRDVFKLPVLESKERDDGTTYLCVKNDEFTEFDMYAKKGVFNRSIGFIPTNMNGKYVAIVSCWAPFFLIPILICLLALLLKGCPGVPGIDSPTKPDDYIPDIDEGITNTYEKDNGDLSHEIKVKGFTSWSVPVGQMNDVPILLENPEGNPCYFRFSITLDGEKEPIYESKDVPPGEALRVISLKKPLKSGTYDALVHITTKNLDTGKEMNTPEFKIKIIVSGSEHVTLPKSTETNP